MRIVAAIKERLEQNAIQRSRLAESEVDHSLPRPEQIHLEFLRIEAQTYQEMLGQIRNRRWSWFRSKKISLAGAVGAMSLYVLGIFYMFKEMDLSRVEQWQFAVTTLPFWFIIILAPMVIIALMTSRINRF